MRLGSAPSAWEGRSASSSANGWSAYSIPSSRAVSSPGFHPRVLFFEERALRDLHISNVDVVQPKSTNDT